MSQQVDAVSTAAGSAAGTSASGVKKRLLSLDLLRIFAILLVIFNHTKERGYWRFLTDDPSTFLFWFNLFFSIVCKIAVPLFFMISGALLLRKEESIGRTYKRGIRILIALLIFTAIYYVIQTLPGGGSVSVIGYFKTLLRTPIEHLWYLYSYLTLLMTIPILRGMAKGMEVPHAVLMIILAVVFAVFFPIAVTFWGPFKQYLVPGWIINPVSIILYYPLLGYVLNEKLDIQKVSWILLCGLWCFAIVLIAITEIFQCRFLQSNPGDTTETWIIAERFFSVPLTFVTFRKLFEGISFGEKKDKVLTEVGICTYGIYLIHHMLLWNVPALTRLWNTFEHGGFMRNEFGVVLTVLVCFFISLAIIWVLRRIPVVKKLF